VYTVEGEGEESVTWALTRRGRASRMCKGHGVWIIGCVDDDADDEDVNEDEDPDPDADADAEERRGEERRGMGLE
jgi:hypothetical protein